MFFRNEPRDKHNIQQIRNSIHETLWLREHLSNNNDHDMLCIVGIRYSYLHLIPFQLLAQLHHKIDLDSHSL